MLHLGTDPRVIMGNNRTHATVDRAALVSICPSGSCADFLPLWPGYSAPAGPPGAALLGFQRLADGGAQTFVCVGPRHRS
jgi:hypothetical protein